MSVLGPGAQHETASSAAHALKLKPGKTFHLQELTNGSQFSRFATPQEKASVASNRLAEQPNQQQPSQPSQARGRGRGRGRGRDGRGRGRGRGGRASASDDFTVDDDEDAHFQAPSVA